VNALRSRSRMRSRSWVVRRAARVGQREPIQIDDPLM
jgi:hypothetical protein